MHVAVFLQHYHTPDCATAARPWSLVRALAQQHEVTLITTDAWREQRLRHAFDWVPPSVRLVELRVPYANAMTTPQRLRSYLGYAARALWAGVAVKHPPDLVYVSSTPLTVGVLGAVLATRWRCPWIFEVRDLWPDFPVQMGTLDGRPVLRRTLYALEHFLYRSAARVITVSPDMAAHIRRFTSPGKVSSVEYGTDLDLLRRAKSEDVAALRAELEVPEKAKIVLYAGSFGRANDLPTVVETARQLRDRPELHFVFAGRGYHRPLLVEAERALPNVHLLGPAPYPQALALFRLADLSLVPFLNRPVLAANAPSKFFDSLAAGTPVIVTNPGWTKSFVERHECGWHVSAEHPQALAHRIETALRDEEKHCRAARRAREAAYLHFDRAVHMRKILSIIEEVRG